MNIEPMKVATVSFSVVGKILLGDFKENTATKATRSLRDYS